MTRFVPFLFVGLFVFGLVSCSSIETQNKYTPLPQLTFEHLVSIPVKVGTLDIVSETERGAQPWDIANNIPTPPDVAMDRYLRNRFVAKGGEGDLTMTLKVASIKRASVANDYKILSYFSLADNDEYTFEVIVDMKAQYVSGMPDRETRARFVRKVTMRPSVTMAYRESVLQRTLEEIISDIDASLTQTLVHDFNLVNLSDVPVKSIEAKTEIPEEEPLFKDMNLFETDDAVAQ